MAQIIDGKAVAAKVRDEVRTEAAGMDRKPGLATILVGDDPASDIYIRYKHRAADEVGIEAIDNRLPATTPEADVLELVEELNNETAVDGILVQTPLPDHIDEARVMRTIEPIKDVDGLNPFSAGQLYLGQQTLAPATPLGVMQLLEEYEIPTTGARAVVVGRSTLVGKPLSMLLLQANATVTICHSRTQDLARHTRDADILVAAAGSPRLVTVDMVKQGAAVIDVGITRTPEGLMGDVDPAVADVAAFLTPVPGGVGPMTIAALLRNAVRAAQYRNGLLAFPRI
jgi:methylenetetrahydrofolate dehydrogenase (NADP+)/methenyltetrahydrofolate cyclohydrolase